MNYRVTYILERGSPNGLVKHAVAGEVVACDDFSFEPNGVLALWSYGDGGDRELVKAYGPSTWRTIMPAVGAADQSTEAVNENPPKQRQAK